MLGGGNWCHEIGGCHCLQSDSKMRVGSPTMVMAEDSIVLHVSRSQRSKIAYDIQKKRWLRDALGHIRRTIGLTFGDNPKDFIALFHCIEGRDRLISPFSSLRKNRFKNSSNRELQGLKLDLSSSFGLDFGTTNVGRSGGSVS
ncbi:uncharacterized protein LOC131223480 [Magnolia sinica]|uniref:uncharacterized protein LOC131223480 n=1 Tax=Magnolia sinica TaxID=86752 RepID=UPI00265829C3|nr:uncharacterized protein LOC131223480 [Magnolia sinica]